MDRGISPPPAKRTKVTPTTIAPSPHPPASTNPGPPPEQTMRIFSWNINGITPFLQKSITSFFQTSGTASAKRDAVPPASLRAFLRRHHWPSMLLLQEVKIASKDTTTQDAVRTAVNDSPRSASSEPTYDAHFTLPDDPFNARGLRGSGKVYGVCTILRRDLRDEYEVNVRTVPWDSEGRVCVVELTALAGSGSGRKISVFNIYAVNGTENAYRNPKTGITKGTRHDRKLEFQALLADECRRLEEQGWLVLIGGDMNVAPDARDGYPKLRTFPVQHVANRLEFHKTLLQHREGEVFGGVDVWRQMHGDKRRYTYYSRGRAWGTSCDRVDYFIAGKKLWDEHMVTQSGILDSETERGPSDHVPIWIDIDVSPPPSET